MKKIILCLTLMMLYCISYAQMPMNMPMGNKPNPKTTPAKAPAKMKGMDMPVPKKKTGNQQNMQDMQMNNK